MNHFLIAGILLALSIAGNKLSDRFGVPALLVFLGVGMLAGAEGPGGIAFDSAETARTIGDYALAVILFSGGLDTAWRSVRPVLGKGLVLATAGVGLTTLFVGRLRLVRARQLLFGSTLGRAGLSWPEALLIAAIMSSTDAAAVFSQLRSGGVRLRGSTSGLCSSSSPAATIRWPCS